RARSGEALGSPARSTRGPSKGPQTPPRRARSGEALGSPTRSTLGARKGPAGGKRIPGETGGNLPMSGVLAARDSGREQRPRQPRAGVDRRLGRGRVAAGRQPPDGETPLWLSVARRAGLRLDERRVVVPPPRCAGRARVGGGLRGAADG